MSRPGPLARLRVSRPVNLLRYHAYRDVLLAYPHRRQCNVCGWRGRRFLAFVHAGVLCPKCGSMVRHRLIAAAFALPAIRALIALERSAVLHVSAEYCLRRFLSARAAAYVAADYATSDGDIQLDITDMRGVTDDRFDVIVACDVLEHIPDDRAALSECRRVLKAHGTAIFSVPQPDAAVATHEDASIVSFAAREATFGQGDHVRLYGSDFAARLESAGFRVTVVDASSFGAEMAARHVLAPPVLNPPPFDDNRRRIYFATK